MQTANADNAGERRRKQRLFLIGIVVINMAVLSLLVLSIFQEYRLRINQAEIASNNLSRFLQMFLAEKLKEIDLSLLTLQDELEGSLAGGKVDRRRLNDVFERQLERLPESDSLRASDSRGVIRYGTGVPETGPRITITDRDYYIKLKKNPDAGMVASKPILGKISGKWVVIFSRAYRYPDGTFAGVIYAPVTLEYFTEVFSSLDTGRAGVITFFNNDAVILARFPDIRPGEIAVTKKISGAEIMDYIKQGKESVSLRARSSLDGVERFFSIKTIPGHPLYIAVGLSTGYYMKPWTVYTLVFIILAVLFMTISGFFIWQIRRGWNRLEAVRASLEDALASVKTLSGLLPICASCKRIRDDNGYWNQIESYISEHSEADFSHSLCPDCARKLYPDLYKEGEE